MYRKTINSSENIMWVKICDYDKWNGEKRNATE